MRRAIFLLSLLLASTTLPACSDDETPDAADPTPQGDRYAALLSQVEFGAQITVIEDDGTNELTEWRHGSAARARSPRLAAPPPCT